MATNRENDIIDINIDGVKKQRFRINGDDSKVIELNISDIGIAERLEKGYENLQVTMTEISEMDTEDKDFTKKIRRADDAMREQIDYIFDSNVSEILVGSGGTMYDPVDGMFRFERILDGLTRLYENNLNSEYKKMQKRIQKHTDKYTKAPNVVAIPKS